MSTAKIKSEFKPLLDGLLVDGEIMPLEAISSDGTVTYKFRSRDDAKAAAVLMQLPLAAWCGVGIVVGDAPPFKSD